ncbi:uncharacterized protein [Halyomorpha halys]|uniref:uncharacterized protein n=1 Tax=Halyomorpha halys TaxID=286706 RepID=UPI0006D4E0EA|nr:uncharacterized protein LOC106687955 [Halyomorpha halys]
MCQSSSILFILFFTQFFVGYVDPRKIICPPGKTQFPNPDDRHSFYKCDAGGNPILFPCPAKTWFNPCLEVCDWDTGNYNCQKSGGTGQPSNPGSGSGNSGNKYPSGPTNNGSGNNNNVININININGKPSTGADTNRPQDQSQSVVFPNQPIPPSHGGYRPQPNSPSTPGTSQANYPTKLAPNQSCSTYGLLYQNPEDCSTYFMCNQRRLVLVHCTRGYFYIPERKRCETTFPNGCKFVEHSVGESKPIYETENDVWQYQRNLKG